MHAVTITRTLRFDSTRHVTCSTLTVMVSKNIVVGAVVVGVDLCIQEVVLAIVGLYEFIGSALWCQ